MTRTAITILALASLLSAGSAWAGAQGGPGDDGQPPNGIVPGDAAKQGNYVATAALEFRDIPNTGGGTLSNYGARSLRLTARLDDGTSFKMGTAEFVCGDPALANPCTAETVCVLVKNKEECSAQQVIDIRKVQEIQVVTLSLLIQRIVDHFGLDPATTFQLVKVESYVQTLFPVKGADGVFSHSALADLVLAAN